MLLKVQTSRSTVFISRSAFESAKLQRGEIDARFNLTDAEVFVQTAKN